MVLGFPPCGKAQPIVEMNGEIHFECAELRQPNRGAKGGGGRTVNLKGFRTAIPVYEVPWRDPSDLMPPELAGQTDIMRASETTFETKTEQGKREASS